MYICRINQGKTKRTFTVPKGKGVYLLFDEPGLDAYTQQLTAALARATTVYEEALRKKCSEEEFADLVEKMRESLETDRCVTAGWARENIQDM